MSLWLERRVQQQIRNVALDGEAQAAVEQVNRTLPNIESALTRAITPDGPTEATLSPIASAGQRSGAHSLQGFLGGLAALMDASQSEPAPFYLTPPVQISRVVASVNTWGIAVLQQALDPSSVAALNDEFDRLMAERSNLQLKVQETEETACIRASREMLAEQGGPLTTGLFSSDVFREIADRIYGDQTYSFNHSIFIHETREMAAPFSGELHFDATRMLKFWVYLEDAHADSGAMRAVPGSQHWLRPIREDYSNRLVPKADIRNTVEEASHTAVPITGPAGTLFIFDTDMAHGALPVSKGRRRRVLRGHCTASDLLERVRLRG